MYIGSITHLYVQFKKLHAQVISVFKYIWLKLELDILELDIFPVKNIDSRSIFCYDDFK